MLNLFTLYTKNITKCKPVAIKKDLNYYKDFPISTRE